jgi:hypothetical protein
MPLDLRSTHAVRERCGNILQAVRADRSRFWAVHTAQLENTAEIVAQVTRARYPDGAIPYHSRWRHFEAGGVNRHAALRAGFSANSKSQLGVEWTECAIDLIVSSVLLDAGAGAAWGYLENGVRYTRSEGLGVASLRAFARGQFSSNSHQPLQADASKLIALKPSDTLSIFQVTSENPLVGVEGRTTLLNRLGVALQTRSDLFGAAQRPAGILSVLTQNHTLESITASDILRVVLDGFSTIWPSGNSLDGVFLGDCWQHPLAGGEGTTAGWVPFHKLSQWLTYSLIEAFEQGGISVTGLDALTALPEYRNGGLLIDTGVIQAKDAALLRMPLSAADEAVIEWRALTVALMDELGPLVRARLGEPAMPLAKILEGGTWAAGRVLAQQLRGGLPPLDIATDGTVF